jgi:hypothetical protein
MRAWLLLVLYMLLVMQLRPVGIMLKTAVLVSAHDHALVCHEFCLFVA